MGWATPRPSILLLVLSIAYPADNGAGDITPDGRAALCHSQHNGETDNHRNTGLLVNGIKYGTEYRKIANRPPGQHCIGLPLPKAEACGARDFGKILAAFIQPFDKPRVMRFQRLKQFFRLLCMVLEIVRMVCPSGVSPVCGGNISVFGFFFAAVF